MLLVFGVFACSSGAQSGDDLFPGEGGRPQKVRPGISVLLTDSIHLVKDSKVGLITNQTGLDERGRSSVDLLFSDSRALEAGVKLAALFSPEHGIRGTEDRSDLPSEVDAKTGLIVHSLYKRSTIAPPDSTIKGLDILLIDLQDIGTRTWTYVGVMLYAMHSAGRNGIPVVVLDRPNPINGLRSEGFLLDSAIADSREGTESSVRNGFSLWPIPLRHGLTMGEMALMMHRELGLPGKLHIVPVAGWRRAMWFDDTKLPWVKPSPNLPNLESTLLYPSLVPFEATNVSVGRGTEEPFQRIGAPWMDPDRVIALLENLELPGVSFRSERYRPEQAGDSKYNGVNIPGIRITVRDRDRVQSGRLGAALIWAVSRIHSDSLRVTDARMDERLGSAEGRRALLSGADPDRVMDRILPDLVDWEQWIRRYHLYR